MGSSTFPYGTFTVNMAGSLVIGVVIGLAESHNLLTHNIDRFLIIGLLGSFTTFSAFGIETFSLLRESRNLMALANIGLQPLLGLTAVAAGYGFATQTN